jgi:hypothetical protein
MAAHASRIGHRAQRLLGHRVRVNLRRLRRRTRARSRVPCRALTLDLCVQLVGSDEPLYLRGEVRWIRSPSSDGWPDTGLRFQSISPQDEARIQAFLQARAPLFFEE